MATTTAPSQYSLGEEIANAITHGLGVLGAIVGLCVLVVLALERGNAWLVASVAIYGATLVLLYTSSTLYHSLSGTRARGIFKIVDHSSIYLLIAGSYTPFTLVTLRGSWGWSLFAVVWTLALVGVATEALWVNRPKWLSAVVYLGMGWLVVVAIKPLIASLPPAGWRLLLAGGVSYTVGCVFYVLRKIRYMHAVWHLWVLAGSACHFLAVLLYVVPAKG